MEFTDKQTEELTIQYSKNFEIEKERQRQELLVRDSAKNKLVALGFSPNEIASIMGEPMIDNGSGLL